MINFHENMWPDWESNQVPLTSQSDAGRKQEIPYSLRENQTWQTVLAGGENWWITLMCLSIGTPKNNKFSIWSKWKIHYF